MKPPTPKRIQDYLPEGWAETIQNEAKLAGHKKGISIPTIKRVVQKQKVTHKLWPLVWAHVERAKEREAQLNAALNPAA